MSKSYTVTVNGGTAFTASRKDRAIKLGEETGASFEVLSPAGAVVHTFTAEPVKPERGKGQRYGALTVDRNPAHDLDETEDGVTIKAGKKWTYIYDATGSLIAEVRNDAFSTIVAVLEED